MLTPEELQRVGETLLPQLDTLNTWIVSDMIERFMIRFGRGYDVLITGTDAWQAWVLQQSGEQLDAVQDKLAKETGKTKEEIAAIFEEHGVKAIAADAGAMNLSFYRLSPVMMEIISDAYDRTLGEIKNLTRTTAGIANQTFIDIMDETYWRVRTGAQSYTAAVADAVLRLSKVQADVRYPSGHVDHLETAVLRAVRTGVSQSSGNCSLQLCKEYGWNHVLVSEHIGARVSAENPIADHAGWQGKVYCIEGSKEEYPNLKAATGYPDDPLGLCGYNCRHSFAPFLPGVSKNPYDGKHVDTEENRKAYALSQEQRRMERIIRAQKRKCAAQKTAIEHCEDPIEKAELQEQYNQCALRLQRQNAAYADFCKNHDLNPYYDRIAVAGWDRSQAAAASAAARKMQKKVVIGQKRDTMIPESGLGGVADVHFVTHLDIEKYRCVSNHITTDEVIITDVQIAHIRDRHPEALTDFEKYARLIVDDPDYILENRPNTGLLLKRIEEEGKQYQLVLRLRVPTDSETYKNSIITFTKIRDKEWKRLLRNKKILYKKE